ncbi:MAG TPA: adenosine kinase, partial [Armatimonadota bacterium]|nr:adenosine kinase [Armatimonadota bacterium]
WRDDRGESYLTAFRQLGGDCSRLKFDEAAATACCLCLVTPDSERTMFTHLGAAQLLHPEEITPEDFASCNHAHIEGYLLFNPELLMSVLRSARQAGCRVSLDLGSFGVVTAAREILPSILADYVDIVFANEEECAAYCGHRDPLVGLETLGALCEVAVVKLGAEGALIRSATDQVHVPASPAQTVVDTTGAGDFWAAGFLYGHQGRYICRPAV